MHNNRIPKYEKRRKLATFATDMQMNRDIIRLAVPNIISNVTVPLMGIASTAIAGHWGTDTAATIGALAIGASIFNFIYWNCSFVRMGTSGLTAQAYGAQDWTECTTMLARALLVAAIIGLLILALQWPLGELALHIMKGDAMTRDYFYARIWAVPAGILLFLSGIPVPGRTAFYYICNVDLFSVQVYHFQHVIKQHSRRAHKGNTLYILLFSGAFANEHYLCLLVTDTENQIAPPCGQGTGYAA